MRMLKLRPVYVLPFLLIAEVAVFTKLSGASFDSWSDAGDYFRWYAADIIVQAAPVLILSLGMTMVLMTAGIDLSIGSMVALIACTMSVFEGGSMFWGTAVPVGLLLGAGLGLTNGLLIARLDVPPIIATLGTMIFYRGLCFIVMGDRENDPFLDVPGYEWFGGVAGTTLAAGLLLLAGGSWLTRSRWRRELLMLGGNRIAARYAAIPTDLRICQVYTLMGLLAFAAAVCFTARNGSVSASSLTGLELQVIVAVVLGGTRVEGGTGSIFGSILGVLLIAVLSEGLRGAAGWGQTALPFKISHLEFVLLGLLLVVGVWLNTHGRRT
jgi:simple sugar transport system permease protein